ncbi:acyltransferase [Dyadobacter sp. LHD-138]|uniref:acyltransferase family protein n=1 Tax=Dyadobacter sp. LHD-138 TaxID=3071413 RepID=UPI0027E0BA04|nr:acyltransferase [Dyadobacter sp. LHD-138]MDQ6480935.1 acyltransferase [Dyadobacter sp. LHD-138]
MKLHIPSLDYLRGFAAIAVCLFHFSDKLDYLPGINLFKQVFSYGHFGVEVFFMISGFVIPLSMYAGNYTLQKISIFMKKRLTRIEPPYLICALLALFLNYLTTINPTYSGKPFTLDIPQLLYHVGYLNTFTDKDWLNPVFWTLAIEFQYYLLIALIFPLINSKNNLIWISTLLIFNILSFYSNRNLVFNFSVYFTVGIVIFRYVTGNLNLFEKLLCIAAVLGFVVMRYTYTELLVVILTSIAILTPIRVTLFGTFISNISFSLYLLHFPIGLRVINLTQRFTNDEVIRQLMIFAALLISVLVSYYYFRFIENPFRKMSQNIKYKETAQKLETEQELVSS